MIINEDNVLEIPRSNVPHALGLEQRILAQTSVLSKLQNKPEPTKESKPLFWRRPILPLMLAASVAAFVVAAMIDVPMLDNKGSQDQLVSGKVSQKESEQVELDEADLQEFLLLQDEYLFAQI